MVAVEAFTPGKAHESFPVGGRWLSSDLGQKKKS